MNQPFPIDAILARYDLKRRDVEQALGVTLQAISHWAVGFRKMTPKHAIKLEQRLQIPRWELRPDLWPNPNPLPSKRNPRAAKTNHPVGASRSPGSAEPG